MTIETVRRFFYIDDILKLVTLEQEAVSLIKEMFDLIKAGGFRLTKFISNNENVMKTIPETERCKSLQGASFNIDTRERILGIKWDVLKDSFIFGSLTLEREDVTKRSILKIVASIFDPLGFISQFVLTAKIFLKQLWRMKLDWNTIIDNNVKKGMEKMARRTKKCKQS